MSCDPDRNTISISPSLSYFPPQGSDFKDKVYKTDYSNNLDAGVSPQHCQNVPDSGQVASSTPASAVNSLNKFMHPQPHPPIMHHPDLVSMMGRTRAPFPLHPHSRHLLCQKCSLLRSSNPEALCYWMTPEKDLGVLLWPLRPCSSDALLHNPGTLNIRQKQWWQHRDH